MVASPAATVGGLVAGIGGAVASNRAFTNLTGQSLDFHIGKALSRATDKILGKTPSGNTAYAP